MYPGEDDVAVAVHRHAVADVETAAAEIGREQDAGAIGCELGDEDVLITGHGPLRGAGRREPRRRRIAADQVLAGGRNLNRAEGVVEQTTEVGRILERRIDDQRFTAIVVGHGEEHRETVLDFVPGFDLVPPPADDLVDQRRSLMHHAIVDAQEQAALGSGLDGIDTVKAQRDLVDVGAGAHFKVEPQVAFVEPVDEIDAGIDVRGARNVVVRHIANRFAAMEIVTQRRSRVLAADGGIVTRTDEFQVEGLRLELRCHLDIGLRARLRGSRSGVRRECGQRRVRRSSCAPAAASASDRGPGRGSPRSGRPDSD